MINFKIKTLTLILITIFIGFKVVELDWIVLRTINILTFVF